MKPFTDRSTTTNPAPSGVPENSACEPGQFYPDPINCNSYYLCVVSGVIRKQHCPSGLHWNNESKNCDWPMTAKCTQDSRKTTTMPSSINHSSLPTTKKPYRPMIKPTSPTTNKKPPKPNRPSSSGQCNEGEYYTHRRCNQYYICVNSHLVPNSCGGNLHWDAIRRICDWPENVKCITTRRYLRLVGTFRSNVDDPCNGQELVSYPGNCNQYLFCLWNRLQAGTCAPGLHFNNVQKMCDWPEAAQCIMDNENENELSSNEIYTTPNTPFTTPSTTESYYPSVQSTTRRPIILPQEDNDSNSYKIVCYFTNWAWYRKGNGRFTPDDIDTSLCTHIVYGFAVLDYSELVIKTHDSWADIDNKFYTRVSALKEKGVKVSLALGGWNDSQGDKYSRLVRDAKARSRFTKHAIEFLEKYGFQGLDLDWEYPVCWQTDCKKGSPDEKIAFSSFVRELSTAFRDRQLLLSAAVSPSKTIVDAGYDVPELAKYFDWIAVMTYDFHGQWDKKTGHVAPLYLHPDDDITFFNAVSFTIEFQLELYSFPLFFYIFI